MIVEKTVNHRGSLHANKFNKLDTIFTVDFKTGVPSKLKRNKDAQKKKRKKKVREEEMLREDMKQVVNTVGKDIRAMNAHKV